MNITPVTLKTFALALGLTVALAAHAQPKGAKKTPPPPPTIEQVEQDMTDLEGSVALWEKEGFTDAKQRASAYQQLLLRYDRLAGQIKRLRSLLDTATDSPPKQDPNGGLTRATSEAQTRQLARLNALEKRRKDLRERIDTFNAPGGGAKPAGAGGGGAAGGAKPPVVTPSAGDAKRK